MANFIVTYDLNGPLPTHKQMDEHLAKIGVTRGRILETVWYVKYPGTAVQLREYVKAILGKEDQLIVVRGTSAAWTNLLVKDQSLKTAWETD